MFRASTEGIEIYTTHSDIVFAGKVLESSDSGKGALQPSPSMQRMSCESRTDRRVKASARVSRRIERSMARKLTVFWPPSSLLACASRQSELSK
jgi:hypothetical protein